LDLLPAPTSIQQHSNALVRATAIFNKVVSTGHLFIHSSKGSTSCSANDPQELSVFQSVAVSFDASHGGMRINKWKPAVENSVQRDIVWHDLFVVTRKMSTVQE
jgi:hypothetical protein